MVAARARDEEETQMSEVQVTLHGYVGGDVTLKAMGRFDMATFRVGTTPRWRDPQGQYRNGETTWTSVTCWRTLAVNVKDSVHVGDAVVVVGKQRTEKWTSPEGEPRERLFVEATTVAHDLAKGTSIFRKNPRREQAPEERESLGSVLEETEQAPVSIDPSTGEPLYPVGTAERAAEASTVPASGSSAGPSADPSARPDDPTDRAA
jgi:single-strand DNA-binding protein